MPVAGAAGGSATKDKNGWNSNSKTTYVPAGLLAKATANPLGSFDVIVQARKGHNANDAASDVSGENGKVKAKFRTVSAVSTTITGAQLLKLSTHGNVLSITPDSRLKATGYQDSEMWRQSADLEALYGSAGDTAPQAPAIAIVDSGIDASRPDFKGRIVADVNLSSLSPLVSGDDEGHGTMVAAVAAGSALGHEGAAPNAPIVSIRTANADGQSTTSDVIAAVDWILAHAKQYNIRVANFSMAGSTDTSVRIDPLDRAVESLWLNGIVVVAAAGNHGNGGAVSMSRAPGNDPFIITVGATDQNGSSDPLDDSIPSWSAYGVSSDGFAKPDLVAPGRYMVAAIPSKSTILAAVPDRAMGPGYMWMSGTSFAAPVVAGAAAQILARHPSWTPDQVKGALMLTSNYLGNAADNSAGVGEVDAAAAASLDSTPPNPNEGLAQFVTTDPLTGGPVFDSASWAQVVASDASWSQAAWASAAWASASWSQASWAQASWAQANWSSSVDSMMSQVNWSEATYAP